MSSIFDYNRIRNTVSFSDSDVETVIFDLDLNIIPPFSRSVTEVDRLLDLIFSVDPITGLPSGDLALYLSPNSNPDVRSFIESTLMLENTTDSNGLSIPDSVVNKLRSVISDDDIANFSRNHGETRDEYALRLHNYFESERENNRAKAQLKKLWDEVECKSNQNR